MPRPWRATALTRIDADTHFAFRPSGGIQFRGLTKLTDFSGFSNLETITGQLRMRLMCEDDTFGNLCTTDGSLDAGFAGLQFADSCKFEDPRLLEQAQNSAILSTACQTLTA